MAMGSPAALGTPAPAGLARPARPVPSARPAPSPVPAPVGGAGGQAVPEVLRPVVTATCWIDPGERGAPYELVIRFSGRRTGVTGTLSAADWFERQETVRLVPGSGPVAVTTRAEGVSAGEWLVRARPDNPRGQARVIDPSRLRDGGRLRRLGRTLWTRGNPVAPVGPGTHVRTRVAALASAPGTITAAWAAFVVIGLTAALAVLVILLARAGVGAGGALAVAAAASLAGAVGARGWYVMLQRGKVPGPPTRGLCIQGFIAGAVAAGVPGLLLAGIPVGTFFDAAAPGMFLAIAVGRQGCFFTGCCTGRLTSSRWGIWSSDGRIGARRVPAQQLEALACLLIGAAALAAFLRFGASAAGTVFIGTVAAYTLARQGLLALRDQPRRWSLALPVTITGAVAALIADILIAAAR
jgi:phosphatidylglycerol:prolipoprotein diacylglycerol transferase